MTCSARRVAQSARASFPHPSAPAVASSRWQRSAATRSSRPVASWTPCGIAATRHDSVCESRGRRRSRRTEPLRVFQPGIGRWATWRLRFKARVKLVLKLRSSNSEPKKSPVLPALQAQPRQYTSGAAGGLSPPRAAHTLPAPRTRTSCRSRSRRASDAPSSENRSSSGTQWYCTPSPRYCAAPAAAAACAAAASSGPTPQAADSSTCTMSRVKAVCRARLAGSGGR